MHQSLNAALGGTTTPKFHREFVLPGGAGFQPSEAVAAMRVFEGEFELTVVLERGKGAVGRPILGVRIQACTERASQKWMRLELDVAIDW